jgi:hypothetical protein
VGAAPARDRRGLAVPVTRRVRFRYKEILHEIFEHLEVKDTEPDNFHGVCEIIRTLRRAAPDYLDRSSIRKTRDDARTILQSIAELKRHVQRSTLSPELKLRLGLDATGSSSEIANMPVPRLLETLQIISEICEAADQGQPSEDPVKVWCAKVAHTLMFRFSDERRSSGSPRSSYRIIAGLLYEILTGEAHRDLKRACDNHLRAIRIMLRNAPMATPSG